MATSKRQSPPRAERRPPHSLHSMPQDAEEDEGRQPSPHNKAPPPQLPQHHDEAVAEEEARENDGQTTDRPPPPATGHLVSLDLPNQAAHPSQRVVAGGRGGQPLGCTPAMVDINDKEDDGDRSRRHNATAADEERSPSQSTQGRRWSTAASTTQPPQKSMYSAKSKTTLPRPKLKSSRTAPRSLPAASSQPVHHTEPPRRRDGAAVGSPSGLLQPVRRHRHVGTRCPFKWLAAQAELILPLG